MIDPGSRSGRALLALLGFLSAAYFHHWQPGWNVNSRLALTYAIVDEHRLTIDSFHDAPGHATNDKAFFEGHFYSDKAIGNALAAVPVYQIARWLNFPLGVQTKRYLCRTLTVSVAFGLLLLVLAELIERQGVGSRHATALAALGGLGTLLYPYATVFYPYAPATLFALLAYLFTLPRRPEDALFPLPLGRVLLAGLAMGAALLFELLFGLVALVLIVHLLASQFTARRGLTAAAVFVLGTLVTLSPLFLYTLSIFGRLTIPYEYEFDDFFRESMATGLMGIHFPPRPGVLWLITFHPFRGLFFHSPLLLFAFPGILAMLALPQGTRRAALCLGLLLGYLVINGGYHHQWWGGRACGPRLLIPAIPFLLILTAALWGRWPRLRPAIVVAGLVSVALQLLPAGIDPQPPIHSPFPEPTGYLLPGTLDRPYYSPLVWHFGPSLAEGRVAWNPALHLGLPGAWSWLPLLILWLGAGLWLWRMGRRSPIATDRLRKDPRDAKRGGEGWAHGSAS